ncbi:hypothetical protein ANTQUA_LOCUS2096 [Anthophora quadrimaculata]
MHPEVAYPVHTDNGNLDLIPRPAGQRGPSTPDNQSYHICYICMFLETTPMIKPEGDDAIFGNKPKKVSSTPLSLQRRRRKTIILNAIGFVLDIDRSNITK